MIRKYTFFSYTMYVKVLQNFGLIVYALLSNLFHKELYRTFIRGRWHFESRANDKKNIFKNYF